MQPKIINDRTLAHIISIDLQKALKKTTEAILEMLQGFVQSEVYDVYDPNVYQRMHDTGEGGFYESWVASDVESDDGGLSGGRSFSSKIFSDAKKMAYIPEEFVHGSLFDENMTDLFGNQSQHDGGGDRTENLDKFIAEGVKNSYDWAPHPDAEFDYTEPRDYWSPLIDLLRVGFLNEIFEESMGVLGIKFVRGWL